MTTPNGVLKSGDLTYGEMVNLSMNQTLARSINTSLVAILPVLAVLVVGADLLGATTLQNYGLALFVGLMSGAYSSIFIASPLLAMMKEREPRYRDLAARVLIACGPHVLTATQRGVARARRRRRRPGARGDALNSVRGRFRLGAQTEATLRLARHHPGPRP